MRENSRNEPLVGATARRISASTAAADAGLTFCIPRQSPPPPENFRNPPIAGFGGMPSAGYRCNWQGIRNSASVRNSAGRPYVAQGYGFTGDD